MERNNGSFQKSESSVQDAQVFRPDSNFPLPSGMKRNSRFVDLPDRVEEEDSESDSGSDSSNDSEYVPPPRTRGAGPRGEEGGLRAAPRKAPEPYWDHENYAAACAAEDDMSDEGDYGDDNEDDEDDDEGEDEEEDEADRGFIQPDSEEEGSPEEESEEEEIVHADKRSRPAQ